MKRMISKNQTFSERRSFERRSERRSNFVSAKLSAAHNLKMSAELSAAHILTIWHMRWVERRSIFIERTNAKHRYSALPPLVSKMDQNQAFKSEYSLCEFFERWFERRFERNSRAPLKFCERWVERRSHPQNERWVERRSDFENERWVERRSLFGERSKGLNALDIT